MARRSRDGLVAVVVDGAEVLDASVAEAFLTGLAEVRGGRVLGVVAAEPGCPLLGRLRSPELNGLLVDRLRWVDVPTVSRNIRSMPLPSLRRASGRRRALASRGLRVWGGDHRLGGDAGEEAAQARDGQLRALELHAHRRWGRPVTKLHTRPLRPHRQQFVDPERQALASDLRP